MIAGAFYICSIWYIQNVIGTVLSYYCIRKIWGGIYGSTNHSRYYFPDHVCTDHHGKNPTAHSHDHLQHRDYHSRLLVSVCTVQLHSGTHWTFKRLHLLISGRAGAEATESTKGINWADHHFHRWYDDHGGRNGTFRIFLLALPDHCQSSQIQHDKDFYHVYDPCLCPIDVYRQHYRNFIPCGNHNYPK